MNTRSTGRTAHRHPACLSGAGRVIRTLFLAVLAVGLSACATKTDIEDVASNRDSELRRATNELQEQNALISKLRQETEELAQRQSKLLAEFRNLEVASREKLEQAREAKRKQREFLKDTVENISGGREAELRKLANSISSTQDALSDRQTATDKLLRRYTESITVMRRETTTRLGNANRSVRQNMNDTLRLTDDGVQKVNEGLVRALEQLQETISEQRKAVESLEAQLKEGEIEFASKRKEIQGALSDTERALQDVKK